MSKSLSERFWEKVTKPTLGGCWEWEGARDPNGYGRININRKAVLAHRVAFELTFGTAADGLFVLHGCDNPSCVNPSHLRAGTAKDNSTDMVARNRQRKDRRPFCKHGHAMSGDNVYVRPDNRRRQCIACQDIHNKNYRARNGAKGKQCLAA